MASDLGVGRCGIPESLGIAPTSSGLGAAPLPRARSRATQWRHLPVRPHREALRESPEEVLRGRRFHAGQLRLIPSSGHDIPLAGTEPP